MPTYDEIACNQYFVLIGEGEQLLLYKSTSGVPRRYIDSQEVEVDPDARVQLVKLK